MSRREGVERTGYCEQEGGVRKEEYCKQEGGVEGRELNQLSKCRTERAFPGFNVASVPKTRQACYSCFSL